jgi:hypothetical protein
MDRARSSAPSNIPKATIPSARAIASEKIAIESGFQFLSRIRSEGGLAEPGPSRIRNAWVRSLRPVQKGARRYRAGRID